MLNWSEIAVLLAMLAGAAVFGLALFWPSAGPVDRLLRENRE
jgi:hypothetical protein